MSYFTGRKDNRQSARDSIVSLRQQLLTLDKREEFLQKKIDEELKKAKANATSNKKRKCPLDIRIFYISIASSLSLTLLLISFLPFSDSRNGGSTSEASV